MEDMEEKETISSAPSPSKDVTLNDRESLLKLLVEKDAEILKLKAQLVSFQEQLTSALSDKEKLQAKIIDNNVGPYEANLNIKSNVTSVSVSVQVPEESHDIEPGDKPMPTWNDGWVTNSASIADILKETAEGELENQVTDSSQQLDGTLYEENQMNSEYIFDSSSGLYYHPATGYYWDHNSGLFYDYTSGLYYWYNEETQAYEAHSNIDCQRQLNSGTDKISPSTMASLKAKSRRKNPKVSSADTLKRRIKRKRLKKKQEMPLAKEMKNEVKTVNEDEMMLEKPDVEMDMSKQADYESGSSGSLASGESELVSDLESGELTSSSEESDVEIIEDPSDFRLPDSEERTYTEAMAEEFPPCIRFIVQESESLPKGDLYIVTCSGGSIGRETSTGHVLLIPDTSVSKRHAEIVYDYDEFCYKIQDLGSQNGTLINKQRLSQSKKKSSNHILCHGDVLQVGNDTKLLAHIHKGHETCEDCEPGQVQARLKAHNQTKNTFQILSKEERRIQQKQELRRIKKKFGLQNSYFENPGAVINKSGYEDKAMLRRKLVGSENDRGQDENPASVHSPITASNKGHKLLAKMGWKEGEGLGKSNTGIAEPINVELRLNQGAGLGSSEAVSLSVDNLQQANKMKRLIQTRQRFQKVIAESESKQLHESLNQVETTLNSPGALNLNYTVPSHPKDTSSSTSVSNEVSDSPSSSSTVNRDSVTRPSRVVWVKGETQQPS